MVLNPFAQSLDLTDAMEDAIHEVIQFYHVNDPHAIIDAISNLANRAEEIANEYAPEEVRATHHR